MTAGSMRAIPIDVPSKDCALKEYLMPLVSIATILDKALREQYAVPLFDTFDMQSTDGMFAAAEQKRAPVIVAVYAGFIDLPNARALAAYIRARAESSPLPVALMLDHGGSFEHCIKAISYGFTDVMYDGSKLPVEQNVANTREVVRAAHAVGARVEAELGHVGSGSEYRAFGGQRKGFTEPAAVPAFVAETGVDCLAVAIGTAHGLYDGNPCIDLDLLRDIRARVDIPLALHGGTGVSEQQFRAVIAGGISKINVATDLFITAGRRVAELARSGKDGYFDFSKTATDAFCERCAYYIELFGAAGRSNV
jgi:fructose-bisphosphate aldolase, class II